ncbi:MAG: CBS domain-containing protein [Marinobacter sp.]|uniref:CBS domain-containing protein n=1 Tax=Marinobacter sp. TaxID=50741 RepID=UPI0034A03A47
MPIFVSEPGRPQGTRLPEVFRGSRVGAINGSSESHRIDPKYNASTDAALLNAQQATAKRAFEEYSETMDSGPESERAYLPVSRLCTPALFTLPASATMADAMQEMDQHGVHHLVILAEEVVAGLVDWRWILEWLQVHGIAAQSDSFTHIELPAFLTATPETDAHKLARHMLAHRLNAALVIDLQGQPSGIVTSTDYLRLYADASGKGESV